MPKRAFTLVELLVVIGIIAVLIGILLPVIGSARRQAGAVKCQTQLREIGLCFKMYENENRGYFPVARVNGTVAGKTYVIDGFTYDGQINSPSPGLHGYWFNFLAKYATKSKVGGQAAAASAQDGELSRRTIFFGCPAFEGYRNGAAGITLVGDTNVSQPGYGMNAYPTFAANRSFLGYPPINEQAFLVPNDLPNPAVQGRWPKAKDYARNGSQRMLIADGKLWLAASGRPPTMPTYPPAVVAQPEFSNSSAGNGNTLGPVPTQTLVDIYRHGKYPNKTAAGTLDPYGGKVAYNILYADGHVGQAVDGREAYFSMRMKFPG